MVFLEFITPQRKLKVKVIQLGDSYLAQLIGRAELLYPRVDLAFVPSLCTGFPAATNGEVDRL